MELGNRVSNTSHVDHCWHTAESRNMLFFLRPCWSVPHRFTRDRRNPLSLEKQNIRWPGLVCGDVLGPSETCCLRSTCRKPGDILCDIVIYRDSCYILCISKNGATYLFAIIFLILCHTVFLLCFVRNLDGKAHVFFEARLAHWEGVCICSGCCRSEVYPQVVATDQAFHWTGVAGCLFSKTCIYSLRNEWCVRW